MCRKPVAERQRKPILSVYSEFTQRSQASTDGFRGKHTTVFYTILAHDAIAMPFRVTRWYDAAQNHTTTKPNKKRHCGALWYSAMYVLECCIYIYIHIYVHLRMHMETIRNKACNVQHEIHSAVKHLRHARLH